MRNPLHQFDRLTASHIWRLPRQAICGGITLYQRTLSPDHGPLRHLNPYGYCRHTPTCSVYAKQVITDRGAVIGSFLAAKRLLTCHPWRKVSDEKILELTHRS